MVEIALGCIACGLVYELSKLIIAVRKKGK